MKLIIFLILISISSTFAQAKKDTVILNPHQLETIINLEKEITQIKMVLEAKQREQKQFVDGVLSQYGDPRRLQWDFIEPNKIIIKNP